ncbi:MAG: hypothetical protein AB1815_13455 [Bacillota bacterium]
MKWIYEHLPEIVEAYRFENLKFVNSKKCPKNEKRPCAKSGPCCLGGNRECLHNECHNNTLKPEELRIQ